MQPSSHCLQNLIHIHVVSDQIADQGNLLRVVGPGFDGQIMNGGGDVIAVLLRQQDGERHGLDYLHDRAAGTQIIGEDNPGQPGIAAGGNDQIFIIARGDEKGVAFKMPSCVMGRNGAD